MRGHIGETRARRRLGRVVVVVSGIVIVQAEVEDSLFMRAGECAEGDESSRTALVRKVARGASAAVGAGRRRGGDR